MKDAQKLIKYDAIALAILLAFSIVFAVFNFLLSLTGVTNKNENGLNEYKFNNIEILDVDVKSANIIIKEGKKFKVDVDNENIKVTEKNNKLKIIEKKLKLFKKSSNLTITIPTDLIFEEVNIDAGVGSIDFYQLSAKKVNLDLGAGSAYIENLVALENASIEGGAGKIVIYDGKINNLELDLGVGELDLTAQLTGSNQIDAGVGKTKLNLLGKEDEYKIKVDKGIGNLEINNQRVSNGIIFGSGNNFIEVNGGIGNIDIYTK